MKRLLDFFRDHILEYLFIALALAGVVYLAISQGSYARPGFDPHTTYVRKIFDDSRVHKIEINIAGDDLQHLLAEPREKSKYTTSVTIDGESFSDVAFSVRGNGSVGNIADDASSDRFSYTLNFKKFNSHNSYYGLDKLVLNGLYFEPSYLESYLAFKIADATGLDTPLTSFTELYINGELKGLYLAIEAVDRSFLRRTGADANATLFHPSPYDVDWDRIRDDGRYLADGETVNQQDHPDSSRFTYGGSDLVYRGDDPSRYNAIFLNATTKYSRADERFIIEGIESLSPVTEKSPEQYWDIDAVAQFFATNALTNNTDNYMTGFAQNYYLRVASGKMSIIPWDNDRAFMINGYQPQSVHWDDSVNTSIDYSQNGVIPEARPLWRLIAENPTYLSRYHDALQKTLDDYILSGDCRRELDRTIELIRHYVYSDPTRRVSIDEFEDNVAYLRNYILLRADSVQRQLWGLSPSTRDEVEAIKSSSET